jgi:hypothetical protein
VLTLALVAFVMFISRYGGEFGKGRRMSERTLMPLSALAHAGDLNGSAQHFLM